MKKLINLTLTKATKAMMIINVIGADTLAIVSVFISTLI